MFFFNSHPRALVVCAAIGLVGCQTSALNNVSVDYYKISGNSTEDLDKQIKSKGPKVGGNRHAIAVARIRMNPDVRFKFYGRKCFIETAKIGVDARVTLPEWTGRATASKKLGKVWDNIDRYARAHEAVHVSIAFNFAKEMENALLALPARQKCDQLETDSKQLIEEHLVRHDQAQRKFDADEQKRISGRMLKNS